MSENQLAELVEVATELKEAKRKVKDLEARLDLTATALYARGVDIRIVLFPSAMADFYLSHGQAITPQVGSPFSRPHRLRGIYIGIGEHVVPEEMGTPEPATDLFLHFVAGTPPQAYAVRLGNIDLEKSGVVSPRKF